MDIEKAELRKLHDYWTEKAGGRAMPSRSDLDPLIDLTEITGHIWLVDVERDPYGFRFRLLGTEVVEQYGMDFTGKRLEQMDFGDRGDAILEEYEATVQTKQPTYARHLIEIEETRRLLMYERLLLPLSDDGETVNMLMGAGYPLEDIPE